MHDVVLAPQPFNCSYQGVLLCLRLSVGSRKKEIVRLAGLTALGYHTCQAPLECNSILIPETGGMTSGSGGQTVFEIYASEARRRPDHALA